jgi:hypothetical protein
MTEFKSSALVSDNDKWTRGTGLTVGTVNMVLPHGDTSIDDDNINLSNFITSLLDNFIYDLALLTRTSVDVDWNPVFLGNRLDGFGSVFGSICDDDCCSGYLSALLLGLQ